MNFLKRAWALLRHPLPVRVCWCRAKPRHFREMLRVLWENRGRCATPGASCAHGVCDGCSLGPRGLRDDVIPGVHLCLTRLKLLRLNTMGADPGRARWSRHRRAARADQRGAAPPGARPLPAASAAPASAGFSRIVVGRGDRADRRRACARRRPGPHGLLRHQPRPHQRDLLHVPEAGAHRRHAARRLAARACATPPRPSGLKETLGWGAPTCSLKDLIGTDLIVLFGTNLANNQPVTTKYLHYAKKAGTRIVVVNPFREPALERYWVPVVPRRALFGTTLMDDFFPVQPGRRHRLHVAACSRRSTSAGGWDEAFIAERTARRRRSCARTSRALDWSEIERASRACREARCERFAAIYGAAKTRGASSTHGPDAVHASASRT